MDPQSIIKYIVEKEISYGLYDYKIDNSSIYSRIRYGVRRVILEKNNVPVLDPKNRISGVLVIKSCLTSLWQLLKLFIRNKDYSSAFFAFPRVDKIGSVYLDKFTDPIVENVDFKNDYIIFDYGRGGEHLKPRLHEKQIVYLDILSVYSNLYSEIGWKHFYKRYQLEFDSLNKVLKKAFGDILSINDLVKSFLASYVYSNVLKYIYKRFSIKRVIGPSRAYMSAPFFAANQMGIKSFEIQHGITYGESQMYSGFRDPMVLPSFFLAFGNNKPLDVYGIDENRIVNIGWALTNYIDKVDNKEFYQPNDVLVISDPEITDSIIKAVVKLAVYNPMITFYIRPHPHEIINKQQLAFINTYNNVKVQNKSINISVVLQSFNHVIGEDSTVLYEALAVNKKVGKLFMEGLCSHYLEAADKECFWEIHDQYDFKMFINGSLREKKSKCIYSPFNKELFCKTLGLK